MQKNQIVELAVNSIRMLSVDAIEKSKSGHPGLPMGAAPMGFTLFAEQMKHYPADSSWKNRDRFILSAGHGSMLLYSLLHLCGYKVSIEDIKNFRQWGSLTPGHPEFGHTDGVETTTGPLGQGAANGVGMAIAETMLSAKFNKPGFEIVDHHTFMLLGDGCMMEGITAEAHSLAGHLKLGKLICLYDSNDISLDGPTSLSFTENVEKRYESYGWQVLAVKNGDTDFAAISKAIADAKKEKEKPTLIIVKTTIGYGSPNKQGSEKSHGAPLGAEEAALAKKALNWNYEPFTVPAEVKAFFEERKVELKKEYDRWNELFANYCKSFPELAKEWEDTFSAALPADFDEKLPKFKAGDSIATRAANGTIMNAVADMVSYFAGGDADLSCSTTTLLKGKGSFLAETRSGRNIHFGVREHAMAAIVNGMAYHGGTRAFCATFFSFVDYMRPSVRLAALAKLPSIFIFTHDSVAVGEDGPTHQPIEQLSSIRSMPGLFVIRPSDATETVAAWKTIMKIKNTPVALILTRQNLPVIDRTLYAPAENLEKGAYILADSENPKAVVIATGSEVDLAIKAYEQLKAEGTNIRVVSMPCREIYEMQDKNYQESVIPSEMKNRIVIEAGVTFGWEKYAGEKGIIIGIDTFGTSAPGNIVLERYGMNVPNLVEKVKSLI